MLLDLLSDALRDGNLLPSYYDSRKFLHQIRLGCESIHACKNDCVLFRKEYEKCDKCLECQEPSYKIDDCKDKKIPHKILRYFPLTLRLQRLLMFRETASHMRWHKENRIEEPGILRHPAMPVMLDLHFQVIVSTPSTT